MAHAAQWKKDEVKELKGLIKKYPVVGVVNVGPVPGKQIQKIRAFMRSEETVVKMTRKRLMVRALKEKSKDGVEQLQKHVDGQAGLLFSNTNPFKIFKILEKNKARAPVKPNTIATTDIMVAKGDTSFPPGPILSELQQGGIPAAIQGGKVVIKKDTVVVRAGEKVTPAVANALARLEVEPLEIKLDILAAYEDGQIYTSDILAVDTDKIISELALSYQEAINLSINSSYLTKDTAAIGISQASSMARNLAINAGIYEKDVIEAIISSAHAKASVIESITGEK